MRRFAAIFPGQGSQYVGMGSDLAQRSASAAVFAEANQILGTDVLSMASQFTEEELARPENNHLAVYTHSIAAWEDYKAKHPTWNPHYFAGHSLGEYSALTAAGVLPLADGLKLVQRRGELLAEAAEKSPGHTIVIMGEALDRVSVWCEELVEGTVNIACYNSPTQVVVSGEKAAVEQVGMLAEDYGNRVVTLKISVPVHSPLLAQVAKPYTKALQEVAWGEPNRLVLSNVSATPYRNRQDLLDSLTHQLTLPVQWAGILAWFKSRNVHYSLEVGPGKALSQLCESIPERYQTDSPHGADDLVTAMTEQYDRIVTFMSRCLVIAIGTKNHNTATEGYQEGVLTPYRRLKELEASLVADVRVPNQEEIEESLGCLQTILTYKETPSHQQEQLLSNLCAEFGITQALSVGTA